ncbi:MAG: hypothetical protein QOH89_2577 [Pseudonocardiales bacterium]|jgi:hypothetical protein|nr:hypothetical protein [Pseudonocardiales bacterium]
MIEETGYEELVQPRRARHGRLVLALVGLAVATVGIIRVADSSPASKPVAAVPTESSSHPFTMPTVELPAIGPAGATRFVPFHPARRCPQAGDGQNACATYAGVSTAFLHAVLSRFPLFVTESAVTQMLRPSDPDVRTGLWSVEFSGHLGPVRIRIAIDRAEPADQAAVITTSSRPDARRAFLFYRYIVGRYAVQLDARAPVSDLPDEFRLAHLANSRQLLQPPAATMDK